MKLPRVLGNRRPDHHRPHVVRGVRICRPFDHPRHEDRLQPALEGAKTLGPGAAVEGDLAEFVEHLGVTDNEIEIKYELQLSWAGPEAGASTDTALEAP
mgnify:CR=1 FL=1